MIPTENQRFEIVPPVLNIPERIDLSLYPSSCFDRFGFSPLITEHINGTQYKQLVCPLLYKTPQPISCFEQYLYVPAGMWTNFASMPRPLWSVLPTDGLWKFPSVFHDSGYLSGIKIVVDDMGNVFQVPIDKHAADWEMRNMNLAMGVPKVQRAIILSGLVIGGGKAWNKCRLEDADWRLQTVNINELNHD